MKLGFGVRHPSLLEMLAGRRPAACVDETWGNGTLPLTICAYTAPADLPDELVTSVRCIVEVGDGIVICENADGRYHIWPGGRRLPGETHAETAVREVHEETGWLLDESTIRPVGWLHLRRLVPAPPDFPYPHPDFVQLVLRASASSRDGGHDADWSDVEGYEVASRVVPVEEARRLVADDPVNAAFLAGWR